MDQYIEDVPDPDHIRTLGITGERSTKSIIEDMTAAVKKAGTIERKKKKTALDPEMRRKRNIKEDKDRLRKNERDGIDDI